MQRSRWSLGLRAGTFYFRFTTVKRHILSGRYMQKARARNKDRNSNILINVIDVF